MWTHDACTFWASQGGTPDCTCSMMDDQECQDLLALERAGYLKLACNDSATNIELTDMGRSFFGAGTTVSVGKQELLSIDVRELSPTDRAIDYTWRCSLDPFPYTRKGFVRATYGGDQWRPIFRH